MMLKVLIKTRIQSLISSMFRTMNRRGRSGNQTLLFAALALFVVVTLLFSVGSIFYLMAGAMHEAGMDWLYFAMAGLIAVLLCFIGSIFATQSTLFSARDNELLLSMPIPPSYILTSRLITLLLLNYMYSMLILIPAAAVYIAVAGIGVVNLIILILGILVLPVLSLALSCVCGWLVGLITAKMRRKNLISAILMIAFFAVYMIFFMNLNQYMTQLLMNGAEISAALRRALPPAYFFGAAIAQGSWLYLLYTVLICVVPMAVIYWLLSRSFIRILTTQRGTVRVEYKEKAMKVSGAGTALLAKELNRFFRTPMYLLNCGIGAAMEILLAGALLIKGPDIIASLLEVPAMADAAPAALAVLLGFCSVLICTTSPSISLEGQNLWILKSSPVTAKQVFHAKLGVNLLVGIPAGLIASAAAIIVTPMSLLQALMILLLPAVLVTFTALLGLIANLHLPRFEWVSETVVVKQSASVTIAIFGSMGMIAIPVILYIAVLSSRVSLDTYLLLWLGIFLLLCAGLYGYLSTKGKALYDRL